MAKNNVIKIELPTTNIEFEIGPKKYAISLADKSRARINKRYMEITKYEDDQSDSTELVISRYQDAMDAINKEQEERKDTDNPMSNEEKTQRTKEKIAEFQKQVDKTDKQMDKHTAKESVDFLDYIFGEGAGKEIYALVDENTIALAKIIFQVMTEFNRENNIFEYRTKYMDKLAKAGKNDDEE